MILAYAFPHVKDWFVWFGRLPQIVQVLSAVATGAALILAFRNWIFSLWDRKVLRFFQEQERALDIERNGKNWVFSPKPLNMIAEQCKRSKRAAEKTLLRLEKRGKVHEVKLGWLPGKRTSVPSTNEPERWKDRFR